MSAAACAAYLSASFGRIYFVRRSPMALASRWHRAAWALRESLTARIIRRLQRRFFPARRPNSGAAATEIVRQDGLGPGIPVESGTRH